MKKHMLDFGKSSSKKKIALVSFALVLIIIISSVSGCYKFRSDVLRLKESVSGLPLIIQTYDDDANIIDSITAKSVQISSEDKFNIENMDGEVISKSPVINLVVGGDTMLHVGSSLIAYDSSIENQIDKYDNSVELKSSDRSIPFINRLYNELKSDWAGQKMLILIRSQTGAPLATFVGNRVRIEDTDIDKSTSVTIDGKKLFIYRCDYTIYDLDLFKD